jgi:hypothetical protein
MRAHPLLKPLAIRAIGASLTLMIVASLAALVRTLPWLLSSAVPLATAWPFMRGLALVALEAALFFGVPIGASVASARFIERGEARSFALMGQAPHATVAGVARALALFVVLFAAVAYRVGDGAARPGAIAMELMYSARESCTHVGHGTSAVPFVQATWICTPESPPYLVGRAPLGAVWFAARGAEFSGDFREVSLTDVRFSLPLADVHVDAATLRGMPTLLPASSVPAWLRASVLSTALLLMAATTVAALLGARVRRSFGAVPATLLGAGAPALTLLAFRYCEATHAALPLWAIVVVIAAATPHLIIGIAARFPAVAQAKKHDH